MTVQMDFDPQGALETAGAELGLVDHRVKGDLKRVREFIESQNGVETGAWRGQVDRPGQ